MPLAEAPSRPTSWWECSQTAFEVKVLGFNYVAFCRPLQSEHDSKIVWQRSVVIGSLLKKLMPLIPKQTC